MSVKTRHENGIGSITLSNPPVNILTRAVLDSVRSALTAMEAEPALRVLILEAEGKHFSAGADVGEHMPPEYRELIPSFMETIGAIATFPLPVIAAVRGKCLGGGFEVAQAADVIVAGEGASFGQPEILLGVLPPAACAQLPSLCSPGLAAELVMTGESITAEQAATAGIVRHVVADDRVEQEARALAARMARHSAAALRSTKRALRAGLGLHRAQAMQAATDVYLNELMQTEDALEGLASFMEKRQPQWKHQ